MKVGVETQTQPRPQASPAQCLAAQGLPASPPFLPQGTVLCDIILLNFLKGADQYKAKKFEEVSEAQERQRDRAGRATGPQGLSASPGAHLPGASEGKFTGPQCILGVPTRGCLAKSGLCENHEGSVRTMGALWVVAVATPTVHRPISISGAGLILLWAGSGFCLPLRCLGGVLGSHRRAVAPQRPGCAPRLLSLSSGVLAHSQSTLMPAFCLQVNETTLKVAASANPVFPSDQTPEEKQSTDSGAFSIGH